MIDDENILTSSHDRHANRTNLLFFFLPPQSAPLVSESVLCWAKSSTPLLEVRGTENFNAKSVTGVVAVVGPCSGAIVFSSLNSTSSKLRFDSTAAAAAAAPSEVLL